MSKSYDWDKYAFDAINNIAKECKDVLNSATWWDEGTKILHIMVKLPRAFNEDMTNDIVQ